MEKRFRAVESMIHFWVLEEERKQQERLRTSFLGKRIDDSDKRDPLSGDRKERD